MNERIRELIEQCTTQYRDGNGGYIDQVDTEKFAELIVRECAGVGYDSSYYECALHVSNMIKQHFGVES